MTNIERRVQKFIKKTRNEKEMSQHELARVSGVTSNYICYLEKKKCNPSIKVLHSILKALGFEIVLEERH